MGWLAPMSAVDYMLFLAVVALTGVTIVLLAGCFLIMLMIIRLIREWIEK
jgi:hypothetical protein